jgi:hypothetical protein
VDKILMVKSAVLTIFAAVCVAAVVLSLRPVFVGARAGKIDENYIESGNCRVCHAANFDSWNKTYHSKMTQDASGDSIQGDFSNTTYEYQGVTATMTRRGADFFMSFRYADGRVETNKIYRAVGSRRIQQYVTKQSANFVRLPVAWDIERKRWMSLNGSFFYADNGDFNQHRAQWDLNCVFCHNVKAQPNFNFQTRAANTEVAELGIACGACHGAAAAHAQEAASPFVRANWHLNDTANKKIVNPQRLAASDSDRSMMICGHCHGQRVPAPESRIREILSKGDPFDAGENLYEFYRPVRADTQIGSVSFRSRFWATGTPRLTAYEYQALTASACFTKGKTGHRINCLSCHTMHEGDPKGQLKPEMRTNLACTSCHTEFAANAAALQNHTKHAPDGAASNCYSCHMPEIVYGIMTFHPTHEISVPRPETTAQNQTPNACNQCHADKSVNWAIAATKNLWAEAYKDAAISKNAQFDQPEVVRMLFAGDALQRSLAAFTLSKNADADFAAPLLIEAFATDNYPIVRFFAAEGLQAAYRNAPKPDYLADAPTRAAQINSFFNQIDSNRETEIKKLAEQLRKLRQDVDLEVGE